MPNYSFREGELVVAYQVWPSDEESVLLHPHCARTPSENEFPLYADDLEEARCLEPIECERCGGQIVAARAGGPVDEEGESMSDEERAQKRKELDNTYLEYKELARQTAEMESKINRLLEELGDEI